MSLSSDLQELYSVLLANAPRPSHTGMVAILYPDTPLMARLQEHLPHHSNGNY